MCLYVLGPLTFLLQSLLPKWILGVLYVVVRVVGFVKNLAGSGGGVMAQRIKMGDTVVVMRGRVKGKTGEVIRVLREEV